MFLIHRNIKEKIEEYLVQRLKPLLSRRVPKGERRDFSSFFFLIFNDHPFPIYAQSLATCPLRSTNYILPSAI